MESNLQLNLLTSRKIKQFETGDMDNTFFCFSLMLPFDCKKVVDVAHNSLRFVCCLRLSLFYKELFISLFIQANHYY